MTYRPDEVGREAFKWAPWIWVIAVIIVGGIFSLIMIFQPWAQRIDTSNARHQVAINQISASAYNNNVGVQQADIQQMETAIADINANDPAHASADARTACSWASKIISIPPGDKGWVAANCLAGGLSPGSQYNQ